jgi:tetratricopeptide (TPR) repeat protein
MFFAFAIAEPVVSYAKVPYRTYTQNGYGELVETQTAYTPYTTITKIQSNIEGEDDFELTKPQDIKIDSNGNLFIADTGNSRIVVCDDQGTLINIIGEDELSTPTGIFVREEEDGTEYIYVADQSYVAKKEGAVIVYDMEGNIVTTYEKPDDILYGKNTKYQPQKVVVDKGGNLYISAKGNSNGVIQISPKNGGTFLGYFATNATNVSLTTIFLNLILSDEQKAKRQSTPSSTSNIAIDEKGLIYTVTGSNSTSQPVKKLNIAGGNLLNCDVYPNNSVAVAVGQHGNIFVGTEAGYIYEYTSEGSLLFALGAKDDGSAYRIGLFQSLSAVAVDNSDRLYVLDTTASTVHIFKPTEFTTLVHDSLDYFEDGKYEESKAPLEQVIQMNGLFDYANMAMGRALYNEEEYSEALTYYRLAKDKDGYSDSYWEIRNIWLNKYIMQAIIIIVLIVIVLKLLGKADKKWGIYNPIRNATAGIRSKTLFKQIFYGFKYMRHPFDGTYGVKREGMCSYVAVTIVGIVGMLIYIINKYFCGFLVKYVRDGRYNIPSDILEILVILLFASIVTYLICTINDGEARFKEILVGYVYSFMPYIVMQPFIYLFGMVVTYNEMFVIEFANLIMFTWIVILLFLSIKELNNYSVKETFKVIGLTIFAAFVFILMAFVIYILFAQIIGFFTSFGGEVVHRIGSK